MTYPREGIDLDVSTLCDWAGASFHDADASVGEIRTHVFAAPRIHADDTVLAVGKCLPDGPAAAYVRDDRPFAGTAASFYSPDRGGVLMPTLRPMPA